MKIRSDFVSNSSSSSFMILKNVKDTFFNIHNKTFKYMEFSKYINFYNKLLVKKTPIISKFVEYINNNINCGIKIDNDEYILNDAIEYKIQFFGYQWKTELKDPNNPIELLRYNYYMVDNQGNRIDDYENVTKMIKESKQYIGFYISSWAGSKESYIVKFLETLADSEKDQFLDSIILVFYHEDLGEYEDSDQRPSELVIFEKYNDISDKQKDEELEDLPF